MLAFFGTMASIFDNIQCGHRLFRFYRKTVCKLIGSYGSSGSLIELLA